MTKKRGKLSNGEMDYIRQNCFDLSIEEIAEKLNRTAAPVQRFIDKENLKARDLTDHEYMLIHLRERYYYKELGKQFSDPELIFFEHQWIDYFQAVFGGRDSYRGDADSRGDQDRNSH